MTYSFFYDNSKFSNLKRRIYLILLPIFVIGFCLVLINLYLENKSISPLNLHTFTVLTGSFLLCIILLLVSRRSLPYVEIIVCVFSTTLYLIRMYEDIINHLDQTIYLGTPAYWAPILYLVYYFVFRGKVAFILSILIYILTLLPGLYFIFSPRLTSATFDTLLQFYIANIGFIIAFYLIQFVIEGFLEADLAEQNANTDYLTKLPNRRKMDYILYNEFNSMTDYNEVLSLILVDLDNFKKINDTFGHDVGDVVLKEFSQLVNKNIPDNIHFGRWGGEEFLFIAPNTNKKHAKELAEKLREEVEKYNFTYVRNLTASFGTAVLEPGTQPKDILKAVDEALYLAKQNGKNQVK